MRFLKNLAIKTVIASEQGERRGSPRTWLLLIAAMWMMSSHPARALPIGFGTNQGELEYSSLTNANFMIYHDHRTPQEGRMTLYALESLRPTFEEWFAVQRTRPLPVVMSAVSENASFANFITDAVELQTLGQGSRDLAWHEYVHATMYQRLDNWFGPAGSLLHLIWMPVWFIEGLAEALSVSVPSHMQAGIERWHALNNRFPTWDRMHSLYGGGAASTRLYATSGAFVSWLMKKYDARKLQEFLAEFRGKSMPWWWPWAAVPFNNFMPMEDALKKWTGKTGEELWAEYQQDATQWWKTNSVGEQLQTRPGARLSLRTFAGMSVQGDTVTQLSNRGSQWFASELSFKDGWAMAMQDGQKIPGEPDRMGIIATPTHRAWVKMTTTARGRSHSEIHLQGGKKQRAVLRRGDALVQSLHNAATDIWWLEQETEYTRLCHAARIDFGLKEPACPVVARIPSSLQILGVRNETLPSGASVATEIWLAEREETVSGDRWTLVKVDTTKLRTERIPWSQGGAPNALAFAGNEAWMLVAEKSTNTLRQLDLSARPFTCQKTIRIADLAMGALGTQSGDLILGLWNGGNITVARISPATLPKEDCWHGSSHTSPILAAMRAKEKGQKLDLQSAMLAANLWSPVKDSALNALTEPTPATPALDKPSSVSGLVNAERAEKAPWRGRPVFAFPWIGAEDALGPQLGVVSVPLMDHMQNETIRATFLVGLASRYPNTDVSLVSTRFWPTLTLSGFRQQTWNGQYWIASRREIQTSYLDEKGARFEVDLPVWIGDSVLSVQTGLKYSHLRPYLGPHRGISRGFLAEPWLTLGHTMRWRRLSWSNSVAARVAPDLLNENFDYNQIGVASTLRTRLDFLDIGLETGLEASRTRGTKRRNLQEIYRPLKTFVPGSGGGYNQNSFELAGVGSLFTGRYGDSQGRAKLNWNLPLVHDLEKFIWIFYFSRLDLTGFYNWGAAWRGDDLPLARELVGAQGYNLDLQFDNKGVNLNAGVGVGQVFEEDWQAYASFGFDALF